MKEPNNTSWEALEKAWQKQIQETSDEVPSRLWDELATRLDEKPARPLWTRVSLSPWTWSAAAIIAIVIGINWENSTPTTHHTVAKAKVQAPVNEQINVVVQEKKEEKDIRHTYVVKNQPKPVILSPSQEDATSNIEQVVVSEQPGVALAKAAEKPEQAEEIWVRIDINPVEENAKPIALAQQDSPVITKKKTFIGRILKQVKQVAAGEQLNWQELKEGNRPLEDGIHLVVNTFYRTEQSIKQTFQIQ
jgi:hypothetical protein